MKKKESCIELTIFFYAYQPALKLNGRKYSISFYFFMHYSGLCFVLLSVHDRSYLSLKAVPTERARWYGWMKSQYSSINFSNAILK